MITTKTQYKAHTNAVEQLVFSDTQTRSIKEEIALLTLLIEKWDADHNSFDEMDPIQLLQSLVAAHQIKTKDLVNVLGISKGYVSDMLNYKKGMSKEVIRKLATHFKMKQEAFNRRYQLVVADNGQQPTAGVKSVRKKPEVVG